MSSSIDPISLFKDIQIQNLIEVFGADDPSSVILKLAQFDPPIRKFVAEQINGRQKTVKKLPFLNGKENIIYPPAISLEQCSSEATAKYKASLVSGQTALDLTAGFGIDAAFLSQSFDQIILVEKNDYLLKIAEHNYPFLNIHNAKFVSAEAEGFLEKTNDHFDLIYIDPSRRAGSRKVFLPEDCEPDVVQLMPMLLKRAKKVMVKLSPMLDLKMILRSFKQISELHILSHGGECKEILLLADHENKFNGVIKCIDLEYGDFEFNLEAEPDLNVKLSEAKTFIYLPNPSIAKAGAFRSLASAFDLDKLADNTHIYSSDVYKKGFPGKVYRNLGNTSYSKDKLQEVSKEKGFNIVLRNFPDDISSVAKKLGIQMSGDKYLMCYRDRDEKPIVTVCEALTDEP